MATLRREGDEIVVKLNDLERAAAFRGDVRVPASALRSAYVSQHPFRELRGTRFPGSGVPGIAAIGSWRSRVGTDFAALYRGGPAVIVELTGAAFGRLLVSAHDAADVVTELQADLQQPELTDPPNPT